VTERRKLSQTSLTLLALIPTVLLGVILFSALPWLKSLPDAVAMTISIGAAIVVMAVSLAVSILAQRRQDEVQCASGRYAVQHGNILGALLVAGVLLAPPFHDWLIATVNDIANSLKGDTQKAPMIAYVAGVATLAFAQVFGTIAASAWWWRGKR
jgi:hypothetical protein